MVKNYIGQHAIELGEDPLVKSAANLFKLIAYNNKNNLTAALIIGGVDRTGPHLYAIPLGGTMYEQKCYVSGSDSGYVAGLMNDQYRENMTKAETQAFVTKCI